MITAKVLYGNDGLKEGEIYPVSNISMGQSYTLIYLKELKDGCTNPFNSVMFEFYEDDEELDIFEDDRFNPYL